MRRMIIGAAVGAAASAIGLGAPTPAHAQEFTARLQGFQEVPVPISTPATGSFAATLRSGLIEYELTYDNLQGDVTQAHIHFGQTGVAGGISAFLCSNADDAPAGVQACPDPGVPVTGTIQRADVIGPAGQGIEPGQFGELARAMRAGITYANVHTTLFPAGEIRGQVRRVRTR
jgi:CHRD domain